MIESCSDLNWIQTFSGRIFSFTDPQADQINIFDIAHALSQLCRYSGHSNQFYSVAQHSVLVSYHSRNNPLWGLLHDGAEAYINDLSAPLKGLPELSGFKFIEKRILAVIASKYGLDPEIPEDVKIADVRMLLTEKKVLFNHQYKWDIENRFDPYCFSTVNNGTQFTCWDSDTSYVMFTKRFAELTGRDD